MDASKRIKKSRNSIQDAKEFYEAWMEPGWQPTPSPVASTPVPMLKTRSSFKFHSDYSRQSPTSRLVFQWTCKSWKKCVLHVLIFFFDGLIKPLLIYSKSMTPSTNQSLHIFGDLLNQNWGVQCSFIILWKLHLKEALRYLTKLIIRRRD